MLRAFFPCVLFALASLPFQSSGAQPIAGLDLVEIRPPSRGPTRSGSSCRWVDELPDDVLFERVPVSIGYPQWMPIARAFYALDAMGELERLDAAMFGAIHVERKRLYDRESVVGWVGAQGIDADAFAETYDSFGVDAFVRRAEQTSNSHKVFSIPALAVDGRYLVAIVDDGTFERQLARVGELIERLRAERRAP